MEKLTDLKIKALKPKEKEYYIREQNGFVLRVRPSGAKSYYYIYDLKGKRQRLFIGAYPAMSLADARTAHGEAWLKLQRSEDPKLQPVNSATLEAVDPDSPATLTCQRLVDLYLGWSEKNHVQAWANTLKTAINKYFLIDYGHRLAADIKRRDAIYIAEKLATKPGAARNLIKALRGAWKYALNREYLESNPFADARIAKEVPAVAPQQRKRILSDEELKHLWRAIEEGGGSDSTKRAIKLILLTGQRPGEVAGMTHSEIQLGEGKPICKTCRCCGWWTIPVERRKTKKKVQNIEPHRVYLSRQSMELVNQSTDKIYICHSEGITSAPVLVNSISHHVRRVVQATGKEAYYGLKQWQPHDLRRTAATGIARLGALPAVVEQVLGHSLPGVAGTYNLHTYDSEKQRWLTAWDEHLYQSIIS